MKKPIVSKKYREFYIETAKQRVFDVLLRYPEKEFSLSELARSAKVAKANIGDIINELKEIEFIQIIKFSNLWRIKANQSNWGFIRSKIVYNLNFIYQYNLVEFLIDYFGNPKSIILFGSFRLGRDISNSDIDIAIEREDFEEYKSVRLKELERFEEEIGRDIQIHLFNRNNVDINVFNNIANGIVLFGFLEVKK